MYRDLIDLSLQAEQKNSDFCEFQQLYPIVRKPYLLFYVMI